MAEPASKVMFVLLKSSFRKFSRNIPVKHEFLVCVFEPKYEMDMVKKLLLEHLAVRDITL